MTDGQTPGSASSPPRPSCSAARATTARRSSRSPTAAGAPFGSLYHFFPGGKEELGDAVMRSSGQAYLELFELIYDAAADPAAAISDFFDGAAAVLEETGYLDACPIGTVALEVASTNDRLRQATADVFDSWVAAATARFGGPGSPATGRRAGRHAGRRGRGRVHAQPRRPEPRAHARRRRGHARAPRRRRSLAHASTGGARTTGVIDPFAAGAARPGDAAQPLRQGGDVRGPAATAVRCSDELIDFHLAVADGGVGMTTLAFCAVSKEGRGAPKEIDRPARARCRASRRFADAVRAHGRGAARSSSATPGRSPPRSVARPGWRRRAVFAPQAMRFTKAATDDDLERIIGDFADAAGLAVDAGFSMRRAALRPRLPAERVPQPEAQPARRPVGRPDREPGPARPGGRARRCATGSAPTSR